MLTINATEHDLMQNFHRTADEKRMVVILPEASYGDWLDAPPSQNMDFLRQDPTDRFVAEG